jgi:hypothetical protein
MIRYSIGSCGNAARDHAVCDGPHVVAIVNGAGYPAGKGWHPRTAELTQWIVDAMNEKAARDEQVNSTTV